MYDVEKVPGIHFYKTNNIKMKFAEKPKKNWCIDGEKLESKNKVFHFTINKDIYAVLPRDSVKRLFVETKDDE